MQDLLDSLLNLFLDIISSVTNTIKNSSVVLFLKKHIKIIKLIFYICLFANTYNKIFNLNIKTEKVNLDFKLAGYVLNIIIILYSVINHLFI